MMVEPLGNETLVHCRGDNVELVGSVDGAWVQTIGDRLGIALSDSDVHFFDATTGVRIE